MRSASWAGRSRLLIGLILAGCSVAASAVIAPAWGAGTESQRPLRILLTNDDGWNAHGIRAVHAALEAAGHQVTIVAPLANQSGASARVSFHGTLDVTQQAPGVYSVAGTPGDAAEFGIKSVFADNPPDLVISGSNEGNNAAAVAIHSGTVGAAVTALCDGIPAIAVSTGYDRATGQGPFEETAGFIVRLVANLRDRADGGRLLPDDVGLNVNYPFVEDGGPPTDTVFTETGRGYIDLTYQGSLPEVGQTSAYSVRTIRVPETVPGSDYAALTENKIAISALECDYDAAESDRAWIPGMVESMR